MSFARVASLAVLIYEASPETLAPHLSVTIPGSPGLKSWLRFLSSAEPTDGFRDLHQTSGIPKLKLHERLFDQPKELFVTGESFWMAAR